MSKELRCSFCGKSQDAVQKLILGPGVYICDECVDMINEILQEDLPAWHWRNELAGVPKARQAPPEGQDAGLRITEVVASPPPETDEETDRPIGHLRLRLSAGCAWVWSEF